MYQSYSNLNLSKNEKFRSDKRGLSCWRSQPFTDLPPSSGHPLTFHKLFPALARSSLSLMRRLQSGDRNEGLPFAQIRTMAVSIICAKINLTITYDLREWKVKLFPYTPWGAMEGSGGMVRLTLDLAIRWGVCSALRPGWLPLGKAYPVSAQ
jgi:hypothetical protein